MPDFERMLLALIEVDEAICSALANYEKSPEAGARVTVIRRLAESARLRLEQMAASFNDAPADA